MLSKSPAAATGAGASRARGQQESCDTLVLYRGKLSVTQLCCTDGHVRKIWNEIIGQPTLQAEHSRVLLADLEEQQVKLSKTSESTSNIWPVISAVIVNAPREAPQRSLPTNTPGGVHANGDRVEDLRAYDCWGVKLGTAEAGASHRKSDARGGRTAPRSRGSPPFAGSSSTLKFSFNTPQMRTPHRRTTSPSPSPATSLFGSISRFSVPGTRHEQDATLGSSSSVSASASASDRSPRGRSGSQSPSRRRSPTHTDGDRHLALFREERLRAGSPERALASSMPCRHLVVAAKFANGGSLWDALAPSRGVGQDSFKCEYVFPLLVPRLFRSVLRALYYSYSAGVSAGRSVLQGKTHGGHGNIKPQNILLHSEHYLRCQQSNHRSADPKAAAAAAADAASNSSRRLADSAFSFSPSEIPSVCELYLTDFALPCMGHSGARDVRVSVRTQKFDVYDNINHLPIFSRGQEARASSSSSRSLAEIEADDLWSLACVCFATATGVFIGRLANMAALKNGSWSFREELKKLSVQQHLLWEQVPQAVRSILQQILEADAATDSAAAAAPEALSVRSLLLKGWVADFNRALDEGQAVYQAAASQISAAAAAAATDSGLNLAHLDPPSMLDPDGLPCLPDIQNQLVDVHCAILEVRAQRLRVEARLPLQDNSVPVQASADLRAAAKTGNMPLLMLVLEKYFGDSAVIDGTDARGRSALFYAASRGQHECLQVLLQRGADPCVTSQRGTEDTPLMAAIIHGFSECAETLLAHCPEGVRSSSSTLSCEIAHGTDSRYHRRSMLVNRPTASRGWTPLHYASYHNRFHIVEMCLAFGADSLMKDNSGGLARNYCGLKVLSSIDDVFRLERVRDKIEAVLSSHEESMRKAQVAVSEKRQQLVDRGNDLSVRSAVSAYDFYHEQKEKLSKRLSLLRAEADKERALLLSAQQRELADVPVESNTAEKIRCAARSDDVGALRQLFDYCKGRTGGLQAINNAEPGFGMRAAHYAARDNCLGALKFLLDEESLIFHRRDSNGALPLHLAVINGHAGACRLILEHAFKSKSSGDGGGWVVNCPYHPDRKSALTPLHYAAEGNYVEVIRLLMDFGANPNIRDGQGQRPADRAIGVDALKLLNRRSQTAILSSLEAETSPKAGAGAGAGAAAAAVAEAKVVTISPDKLASAPSGAAPSSPPSPRPLALQSPESGKPVTIGPAGVKAPRSDAVQAAQSAPPAPPVARVAPPPPRGGAASQQQPPPPLPPPPPPSHQVSQETSASAAAAVAVAVPLAVDRRASALPNDDSYYHSDDDDDDESSEDREDSRRFLPAGEEKSEGDGDRDKGRGRRASTVFSGSVNYSTQSAPAAAAAKSFKSPTKLSLGAGAVHHRQISNKLKRLQSAADQRYATSTGAPPQVFNGRLVSELIRESSLHGQVDELRSILMLAQGSTGVSLSSSSTRLDHGGLSAGLSVACVDDRDAHGRTALMLASMKGHTECVDLLITLGDADVNAAYGSGTRPLHLAAQHGRAKAVSLLLSRGAAIDATDAHGNTALHLACNSGKRDCIFALVEGGSSTVVTNRKGYTATQSTTYSSARQHVANAVARRGW